MERGDNKAKTRFFPGIFKRIAWPRKDLSEILKHTVALITAIASIGAVHMAFKLILGQDAKFYDTIPVRYVIDTGHLTMLVKFVWKLTRRIGSDDV